MIVKIKRVDGANEFFQTGSFVVSKAKDMHPAILEVEVMTDQGNRLKRWVRPFQAIYKKFKYKPVEVTNDVEDADTEKACTEIVCEAPKKEE